MLVAASFVSSIDRFAVAPVIVLIAHDLGRSLAHTVWVASAYFLAYGGGQLLWGIASDRWGRVPVMRAALLGAGVVALFASSLSSAAASPHRWPAPRRRPVIGR